MPGGGSESLTFCHQSLKKKQNDANPVITNPVIIIFDVKQTDDKHVINPK
jgi:hypothetical protein